MCVRARARVCVCMSVCVCACFCEGRKGSVEGSRVVGSLQEHRQPAAALHLAPEAPRGALAACALRALLPPGPASPAACRCQVSEHGMQFLQPAEAGGAIQTTLRSLSGNAAS